MDTEPDPPSVRERGRIRRAAPVFALVATLVPATLSAQTLLEPGETEVSGGISRDSEGDPENEKRDEPRGDSDEEREPKARSLDDEIEFEDQDQKEEDSAPSATSRPGVESFDTTSRERVRPDELPPPSANDTDLPDVLRNNDGKLPEPPSMEELSETGDRVGERVYELVSIQRPRAPGDSTAIVHRGHAVVVAGGRDAPPVLLTTYLWLQKSERLYLVPRSLSSRKVGERGGTPTAEHRSLDEMTVDGKADAWLEEHGEDLVRARLFKPDRHRNLAAVVPDSPDELDLPERGLDLFDPESGSPTRLYGFSPKTGGALEETKLLESHPDAESLTYYLQTTYSVPFGAPIVSADGRLLVLTAFEHPKQHGPVLAIPPAPIAAYLRDVLATLD